jgi:hypothetical protein
MAHGRSYSKGQTQRRYQGGFRFSQTKGTIVIYFIFPKNNFIFFEPIWGGHL